MMMKKCLHLLPLLLLALVLIPAASAQGTPGPCPGFNAMLRVGQQGHVTPGAPNNVRRLPGTDAGNSPIGQIPGDSIFSTIGGPVCANGITWWQVSYQNIIGWTGEGRGAERWLDTNTSRSTAPRTPLNGLEGTTKSVLYVYYGCFLNDGQPAGRAVAGGEMQLLGSGGYASFSLSDGLDKAPDLCIPSALLGSAYAVTPYGTVITEVLGGETGLGVAQVTLPYWAYGVPGVWQLGVSGFSIYIEVRLPGQPLFALEKGQVLLGGFAPNEQVVIIVGAPGSAASGSGGSGGGSSAVSGALGTVALRDIAVVAALNNQIIQPTLAPSQLSQLQLQVRPEVLMPLSQVAQVLAPPDLPTGTNRYDSLSGVTVVADANGFYTGPNPAGGGQRVLAVAGASGRVFFSPAMSGVQFAGSDPDSTRRALYDAFFGAGSAASPAQPTAPPASTIPLLGPAQVGTGWQGFLQVFGAGSGVIYGIQNDGQLLWYRHYGYTSGAPDWAGGVTVGTGWTTFDRAFAGDGGSLYGIKPDGDLYWYRHDGAADGTANWTGGWVVGTGWGGFRDVFPGGQGVIYAVTWDGNLLWYRHYGYSDGSSSWAGPVTVGFGGWDGFADVFAGADGVVYGLYPNGDLYRYVHGGYLDGTGELAARTRIATGWNSFQSVLAGAGSALYGIRPDGVLEWYWYEG